MVKWKVEKMNFICGVVIIIILLSGCGGIEQQDGIEIENVSLNLDEVASDNERNDGDQKDYSSYLKKVWIVDDDYNGDDAISCIITGITDNVIEGYYHMGQMVFEIYTSQSLSKKNEKPNFHTVICDGVFIFEVKEPRYGEEDREGTARLRFCEGDRIEVTLTEGGKSQQYMLRPYNISDEDFRGEPTISRIELDSWGNVNLFYANTESNHSIPCIYLTNDHGDIFYDFLADYQHASEVIDVVVEDMDGDGFKDVEVVTFLAGYQFEWYFFQKENGLFAWEVTIMKEDGISKWIRFKRGDVRECS